MILLAGVGRPRRGAFTAAGVRAIVSTWLPLGGRLSEVPVTVAKVTGELDIIAFASAGELWSWLPEHHLTHPGVWVQLQKASSNRPSASFHDILEAGIAFGWSESSRRAYDQTSYLQRFTPRRRPGTTSQRNLAIADRLEAEGRMTPAGWRALGRA
jgi:uncharacterized protein YdeI (YjbR/CyaY-like superfamily)